MAWKSHYLKSLIDHFSLQNLFKFMKDGLKNQQKQRMGSCFCCCWGGGNAKMGPCDVLGLTRCCNAPLCGGCCCRDPAVGGYRCRHCSFTSDRSYNVKSHVEARHVVTGGLSCHLCQTVCPTRKALKMHVFRHHRPR